MLTRPFAALLACLALSACEKPEPETAGSLHDPERKKSPTATPPDFELATLSGETVRLSDHLGRDVILIDFWATFCKPCLRSMPKLDALYEKYRSRGFVVLGVSIDSPNELDEVRAMASRMEIDFPILLDQETRVVALYNPKTSAPYSVLIGRDGRVLRRQEGYTAGDEGSLEADIARALER